MLFSYSFYYAKKQLGKPKSTGFEVVNYTKSHEGDRWLPLSQKAIDIIRRVKNINHQYKECFEDFLFVRNGKIMSPDAVDAQLVRGCKYIGINNYIYNTMTDDETKEAVLNALNAPLNREVTKSDQNIINFPKNKKAKNLDFSRSSAL